MQLYVTKRTGDLRMTASYTWSKALAETSGNGDNPADPFEGRFNYGPTTYDRRHIFVSTYTYSIPFFRNLDNGVGRALLSGYEISGITRLQSGRYLTVTGGTSTGNRRAEYIGGPLLLPDGERSRDAWVNRAAFSSPPDDRRGSSGSGIIQGPGLQVWDVSLRRRLAITERVNIQFQADLFNVFNRANYTTVDVGLGNTNTDATNTFVGPGGETFTARGNANFGKLTGAGPARNIQFGAKLTF
jgi:hypothetical protein